MGKIFSYVMVAGLIGFTPVHASSLNTTIIDVMPGIKGIATNTYMDRESASNRYRGTGRTNGGTRNINGTEVLYFSSSDKNGESLRAVYSTKGNNLCYDDGNCITPAMMKERLENEDVFTYVGSYNGDNYYSPRGDISPNKMRTIFEEWKEAENKPQIIDHGGLPAREPVNLPNKPLGKVEESPVGKRIVAASVSGETTVALVTVNQLRAGMAINQALSAIPMYIPEGRRYTIGGGVGIMHNRAGFGAAVDVRYKNATIRLQGGVSDNADTYAFGAGTSFAF